MAIWARGVRDEVDERWLLSGRRSDLMVGATGLGGGTPTLGAGPVPPVRLVDTRRRGWARTTWCCATRWSGRDS
jgi:hypothetical protein